MRHRLEALTNGMELANKHHLGRKLRHSWLVSYVNFFNLTVHNFRTKLYHFPNEHQRYGIRFADLASSIPFGDLRFANKRHLGRKL